MNREEAPGKSPEEMYIQQKVRVLLMLKKMGSNVGPLAMLLDDSFLYPITEERFFCLFPCLVIVVFFVFQLTPSEEAFLRNYAGVVHSQMSQLPQHNIDQGTLSVSLSVSLSLCLSTPAQHRPGYALSVSLSLSLCLFLFLWSECLPICLSVSMSVCQCLSV